ncbi:MAG: aminotransferase [Phycisphaerae bacterium]|nr:aminotransferase [Phycisphaerae bacterium]
MIETVVAPCPLEDDLAASWMLDPEVTYLNHGSFGARPRPVFEHQAQLRHDFETQPVQSIVAEMEELLPSIRARLAAFIGSTPDRVDLVANASEAVNSILRSIELSPGDEIVIPDHAYNAVHQTVRYVARRTGAVVKVVGIPLPIDDHDSMIQPILEALSGRTRLLLVDHITSPTAIVFPIESLVRIARERGIDVLVDGAHGPGMIPLHLDSLGATWYVGNLHKWVCAPVGAAFIATDPSRVSTLHPAIISHGYEQGHTEEFSWQGTRDYTPWRCIPFVLDWIESRWGWSALREHNHRLAVWGHDHLCAAWGVNPITPLDGSPIGSMATLELPEGIRSKHHSDVELHDLLLREHSIEVPIMDWGGKLWLRISAQAYNRPDDYRRLADVIASMG